MVYTYTTSPDVVNTLHDVLHKRGWKYIKSPLPHNTVNLNWQTYRKGLSIRDYTSSQYDGNNKLCKINHFQYSEVICKKNSLANIIQQHAKQYDIHSDIQLYNYTPYTFILPEHVQQCKQHLLQYKQPMILKPATGRQGKNITIITDTTQLPTDNIAYVCQQYIADPYLGIASYKFDLRVYVLVRSYQPLQIYVYKQGLVRFSSHTYSNTDYNNVYKHLTNFSVNKRNKHEIQSDKPVIGRGCKWTLKQLQHYFTQHNIDYNTIWSQIQIIVVSTILTSIDNVMHSAKSFELFGFDIMLDSALKPWLLEVNASPALATTTSHDRDVKIPMLNDLLNCIGLDATTTLNDKTIDNSPTTTFIPSHKRKLNRHAPVKSTVRKPLTPLTSIDTTDTADESSQSDTEIVQQTDDTVLQSKSNDFGDFERVYPFNDITTALSHTDCKNNKLYKQTAIRELKQLLQKFTKC